MEERMKYYAGIGSRETPEEVSEIFIKVAKYLANKNFTLRSGGAKELIHYLRLVVIVLMD